MYLLRNIYLIVCLFICVEYGWILWEESIAFTFYAILDVLVNNGKEIKQSVLTNVDAGSEGEMAVNPLTWYAATYPQIHPQIF